MVLVITSANSIFSSTGTALSSSEDRIDVLNGGYVVAASDAGDGLHLARGGAQILNVAGFVTSFATSATFGDGIYVTTLASAAINIAATGFVYGRTNGIDVTGSAAINNHGSISSGSGQGTIRVNSAAGNAIANFATGSIANDQGSAIVFEAVATGRHTINNAGTLTPQEGLAAIVALGDSVEVIVNTGLIGGGLKLGGGNDIVRTAGGRISTDSVNDVNLGAGDDFYFGSNLSSENVSGGLGNDTIAGGAGNDTLDGGDDDDRITGGRGADFMFGDGGNNLFIYESVTDSGTTAATRDTIGLFDTFGDDRIDLRRIDAIAGGADNAFAFRGTGAFTAAGQVRINASGDVEINTGGTLAADMVIAIQQGHVSDALDFLL